MRCVRDAVVVFFDELLDPIDEELAPVGKALLVVKGVLLAFRLALVVIDKELAGLGELLGFFIEGLACREVLWTVADVTLVDGEDVCFLFDGKAVACVGTLSVFGEDCAVVEPLVTDKGVLLTYW